MYGSHHHLDDQLSSEKFPAVSAAGGLAVLLRQRLKAMNAEIFIPTSHERPHYANASGSNGSVHVHASGQLGEFVVKIRRGGLSIGRITTGDIDDVARMFVFWLSSEVESSAFKAKWPETEIRPDIGLIEPMGTRESMWNCLLYIGGEWYELLRLLYEHPYFSHLRPNWSMNTIMFFERYPECGVVPGLPTVTTREGTYYIHEGDSRRLGPYNAREALEKLEEYTQKS